MRLLALLSLLALAQLAVAAEVGINDQRISIVGPEGIPLHDAHNVAAAQDTNLDRYLVVYSADPTDGDFEIFGQLRFSSTGAAASPVFRISPADGPQFDALEPSVAYSSALREYLVVWSGDHGFDGAEEIYGRRLSEEGALLGPTIRISSMGSSDAMTEFDANRPAVVFDPISGKWVVVWEGDDDGLAVDGEFELFAQALDASGNEIGTDDLRLFDTGSNGDPTVDSYAPSLAVNPSTGTVVVAFEVSIFVGGPQAMETAIYSFDTATEAPVAGPYTLSIVNGALGDGLDARHADISFDPVSGGFLVVEEGDLVTDGDVEIFVQQLLGDGSGPSAPQAISDMGVAPGPSTPAAHPAVSHDGKEFLVVWSGKQSVTGGATAPEWEIYGQRLDATFSEIGPNDFRLSDMGTDGDTAFAARQPAVVDGSVGDFRTVVWTGDDDTGLLVDGEQEVFAQQLSEDTVTDTPEVVARRFRLESASPNPFNPSTRIAFEIPRGGRVTLRVFDVAGRLVRTLVDENLDAGPHARVWNGRDDRGAGVASGVYLYRLESEGSSASERMVLVK